MFGLGMWEIVVILIVGLLVLGPERLPKLAKQVGKGVREFKKSASELQHNLEEAVYAEEDAELKKRAPQLRPPAGVEPHQPPKAPESTGPDGRS